MQSLALGSPSVPHILMHQSPSLMSKFLWVPDGREMQTYNIESSGLWPSLSKPVIVRQNVVKLELLAFEMEPRSQQVPLCSPGWPSTCSVARAGLELLSCLHLRSAKITGLLQSSRGGEELDLRLGSDSGHLLSTFRSWNEGVA